MQVTDREADEILTLIIRNVGAHATIDQNRDMVDNFTWLFRYIDYLREERDAARRAAYSLEIQLRHSRKIP